jgi:hypothetical protein
VLPANWEGGLAEARQQGVFVAPPVDGYVHVVGRDVAAAAPHAETALLPLLQRASRVCGRAAWFHVDADADSFGWALAERGEIVRAYAFAGERGHVLWVGEVTDAERRLDCFVDDPRDRSDDETKWWPDRRIVHAMAAAWCRDPDALAGLDAPPGTGLVGRL